jgi:hypothetical protein
VKIWDTASGQELLTLTGHTGWVWGVAYSLDGRHLASGSYDQTVKIWDTASGQELLTLTGHTGPVHGVAYSPDGRCVASASYDGTVKVWDATTGQCLHTLKGHTGWVTAVAYSPDSRRIASAGVDRTVRVWDVSSGQECLTLKGDRVPMGAVHGVAYNPDGCHLACASYDQTVRVWDASSGQELRSLKGHGGWVWGLAYSPDGRRIAGAGKDATVKIWDTSSGQECLTLKGHTNGVWGVAFSPDGRRLASASFDQTVKVWDATELTPQRLIERQARGLVQFLIAKPLSPNEAAAAIRRDPTITEAVRQQALAWVEPFWRSQIRYEAARVVEPLFAEPLLRVDVLAKIRADASLSELVRQEALKLAETLPENAPRLNNVSWSVVRQPSADAASYQRALRQAEAASHAAPDNADYLTALGMAYYRMERYREALAALENSRAGHASNGDEMLDLYLLTMCHSRLGHAAKARECFQHAKDAQQRSAARLTRDDLEELQLFHREAERLLGKPAENRP